MEAIRCSMQARALFFGHDIEYQRLQRERAVTG